MESTINTKFFTFNQNNSGGYHIINDDVAVYLIIEAQNAEEAIGKMYDITDDYSEYCSCCGARWSDWGMDDSDGKEEPMIFGKTTKEKPLGRLFDGCAIIYYCDGTKEKLWYDEEN